MQTLRYFRDQAALCLEIAQHMSDPRAAENLRATAAQHFAQAVEFEKQAGLFVHPTRGHQDVTTDDFLDSLYYRAIRTRIGEALRTPLVPTELSPERILNALHALDQKKSGDDNGTREKQDDPKEARGPPEHKPER